MSAESSAGVFSFAVLTDFHCLKRGKDRVERAIAELNARDDLAFVLILGDFLWPGPMGELKALLDGLPAGYHVVFGNHDAARIAEYEAVFGGLYGAFECRGCLFVGLWNAVPALHDPAARHGDADADQQAWLVETLRRARAGCGARIFLFAHIPPVPPAGAADPAFRMTASLSGKLYGWCRQFAVEACFFGHVHYDEVFVRDGTQFITTPSVIWNLTAGASADPASWTKTDRGGYRIVHVAERGLREEVAWL